MVIYVGNGIKQSVWLVEKWVARHEMWHLDGVFKLQEYAEKHIAENREMLAVDEVFRMRRFIEDDRTPRSSMVGGCGNG